MQTPDTPTNDIHDGRSIRAIALEAQQRGLRWGPVRTTRDAARPSTVEVEFGWVPDRGEALTARERLGIRTAVIRVRPPKTRAHVTH